MLRELERKDFIVHSPCKGIYYIEEKVYFPTQIVVSRELEGEQHVWLQALTKKMDKESAKRLLLQKMGLDFESAYQAIIKTEIYQSVSREQVSEYWN
ncbi:MAG: hypothetical protein HFI92_09350 [Lachnospiraceae bacterium]|nr:hypothetical protein [Lachnospiraceae bacterium]